MVGKIDKTPQLSLFEVPLINFINKDHELVILSHRINWEAIESKFKKYYSEEGRPSVPIRKIVGSLLLKQIYDESDEEFIDRWIENPYWQYFCGEVAFQKAKPFDPSEFTHFRNRVGKEGAEELLKLSMNLFGKNLKVKGAYIDTTVQEKNITYPTDAKLYRKVLQNAREIAKEEGIKLRQSYVRIEKELVLKQRFHRHPKRRKEAKAANRKLKTIAGRVTREITKGLENNGNKAYEDKITIFNRVLTQTRNSKNKIYSIHAPEVKCIAKGKEAKEYEFGNKSSIVYSREGIIIGAMAFSENLYDGDTLLPQLEQVKRLTGKELKEGIVDRGYRGRTMIGATKIVIPKPLPKTASRYQKEKMREKFRGRAGIEPIIGHLKSDHRMWRNFLKGEAGDEFNTILAAAAFNIKKFINRVKSRLMNFIEFYMFATIEYLKRSFNLSHRMAV
jgi:IS5 family transposase